MNIDHTNGGGGGGGLYDDIYDGPPRFGVDATLLPRAEDYNEIFESFHASHATSISVLDLSAVDEEGSEVLFNVRSSGFAYSKVFGSGSGSGSGDGGGLDFVVSYEDLLFYLSKEDEEAWYDEEAFFSSHRGISIA